MNGQLFEYTLLLAVAGFLGVALGLLGFAIVRVRAQHAFGQALVRDHVAGGGPFRGGIVERSVAKDAPTTVRLVGMLSLGAAGGDALLHLALGCVQWAVVISRLPRIHREEVGPIADGSLSAALLWALAHRLDFVGFIVFAVLLAGIAIGADLTLARVAVQLLRARSVDRRTLTALVAGTVIARGLDLGIALYPASAMSQIPQIETIPSFVPAFGLPVLALATWLAVRMARPSTYPGVAESGPPGAG